MPHGGLLMIALGALLYIASWAFTATADVDAFPSLNIPSQHERAVNPESSHPLRALAGLEQLVTISQSASSRASFD